MKETITYIGNAKDIGIVMSMYKLIEYSDIYSKASGILLQYSRDQPVLNNSGAIDDLPGNSALFKLKQKPTVETEITCTKKAKLMVLLKYLSNCLKNLKMLLINCEINLILTLFANCVLSDNNANQATTFAITVKELYVPVIVLTTQEN